MATTSEELRSLKSKIMVVMIIITIYNHLTCQNYYGVGSALNMFADLLDYSFGVFFPQSLIFSLASTLEHDENTSFDQFCEVWV